VVHAVVNNMFGLGPGGLPGNEDSGALSSWYVWASLGLFPVAGQSVYLINTPSFAESRIAFADEELLIDTSGFVEPVASGPPQYVRSAIFNGETLDRTWLTARELHRGGHLRLRLGPQPSAWGTTTRPPSASITST
jgi:putative alpha-1,2-mannosidase